MDKQRELTTILNDARFEYKEIVENDIRSLAWVKYRIQFRSAFCAMADEIKKGD